jgi:hypothetical protein
VTAATSRPKRRACVPPIPLIPVPLMPIPHTLIPLMPRGRRGARACLHAYPAWMRPRMQPMPALALTAAQARTTMRPAVPLWRVLRRADFHSCARAYAHAAYASACAPCVHVGLLSGECRAATVFVQVKTDDAAGQPSAGASSTLASAWLRHTRTHGNAQHAPRTIQHAPRNVQRCNARLTCALASRE